jgi:arylsulfatase A-like enzyme/Flp pilus assembly protein TadD
VFLTVNLPNHQISIAFSLHIGSCQGCSNISCVDGASRDTFKLMRVLTFLCCILAAGTNPAREHTPEKVSRPNVFLITIDTLRADHVHCYGYDHIRTPALDFLAEEGIRFTQAFTPSPITNSSHTSILTGLLPSSHGVSDFGVPLAPAHPTLAGLLAERGYSTAAFIGAVILDSKRLAPGLDRGFEFYDNFPEHTTTKSRWGRLERRGMQVEQHAESWLNAHPGGAHFVWVHFYDPHDPYEPPPPYSEIYKDRPYDGEIAYADSALSRFLVYLKKRGWYDGALIVVVGDHGEGLGEHHEDTHGIFLYDSTTHVPLLVKLPHNRKADKRVEAQVRTTDIMPTMLDLLGLPTPEKLDGASLNPLFTGTEVTARTAFGETDYPLRFGWAPLRSVRTGGFKFIEAPKPEFYNLRSDSGEMHNQYEPWDADVQSLRKRLAELNRTAPASGIASPAAVSAGTIDELHALGYLGPADAQSATDVPEPSLLPDPKDKIEEQNLLHAAMMATDNDEPAKARTALEKLLQLDDKSEIALTQLSHVEIASGNYNKALEYLRRALELRPEDTALTLEYARALELNGDLVGARDTLLVSLKANPNQFAARLLLGQIYFHSENPNEALDQLEDAVILQPDNVDAKTSLSKVLISQQKFADVVELLEPLAKSSGNNADVFDSLAQAYTGLGRLKDAQHAEFNAKTLRGQKK